MSVVNVFKTGILKAGVVSLVAAVGALLASASAFAADSHAPKTPEFSPSAITCLEYTNGLGENSVGRLQSEIAHIWMLGYMAGYYKAQDKLEETDDHDEGEKVTNLLLQRCRENPAAEVLVVTMKGLTLDPHKLPTTVTAGFSPDKYTCGQHVDAKGSAANDANKADLVELWGFGFIQGYKNVGAPDMELPATSKPQLMGAVNKSCGTNRNMLYMDMTALVAQKVKLAN